MKNILLINDMPGYGKVALSAMLPVLSRMGYTTTNLPTALVSNTLDYGVFEIQDNTDYMRNTIDVWNKLDIKFDCLTTGFILGQEQVALISDYIDDARTKHPDMLVVTDPIMGDDGKRYNGISESIIPCMRDLCAKADILLPNYTEAAMLADADPFGHGLTPAGMDAIIGALRDLGAKSVVVTSVTYGDGGYRVVGYDHTTDTTFNIPYRHLPVRFPGTGDIFSAVLTGHTLAGESLRDATKAAMDAVSTMLDLNRDREDKFVGIPIEATLSKMKVL